jgi:hypothetical protein
MKFVILDAGPIISLTLNGLLNTLEKLKQKFPEIIFVITPDVYLEVVEKPMKVKKYELEAIKVRTLIDKKTISLSSDFVKNNLVQKETQKILEMSNSILKADRQNLQIIQAGEASCLAFANLCNRENLIVVDERAIRLLTESPENLKAIMEKKLHMTVSVNPRNLKEFKSLKFIRSTELAYLAFKNKLYDYAQDKQALDAILYSLKYSGTSISSKEIEEIKEI